MKQAQGTIEIHTDKGKGCYDITFQVAAWLAQQGIETGLLTVFIRHTSASLIIQENADPDVLSDMDDFLEQLAPEQPAGYRHVSEGPDDMPSHIRAALTGAHLSIPIVKGRLGLGTWQGIFVYEHRQKAHYRSILLHAIGQ